MGEKTNPVVEMLKTAIGEKLDEGPPFTLYLDGRITNVGVGELEMTFATRPEWANPAGLLHGGMQAAILDEMIGFAAFTLGEEGFMLSIDLHVNFLGKVTIGETVKARAKIVRHGRRISHAVCELYDEAGNVVTRADANLVKSEVKS